MKSYDDYLQEQQIGLICNQAADAILENNISVDSVLNAVLESLILEETNPEKLKFLQSLYSELSAGGVGSWLGGMAGKAVSGVQNFTQGMRGAYQQNAPAPQQPQQPDIVGQLNNTMQLLQQSGFDNAIPTMQQIIQQVQQGQQQPQAQPQQPQAQGKAQQETPQQKQAGQSAWAAGMNNVGKQNSPGGTYNPADLQKTFGVNKQQQPQQQQP